MLDRSVIPAQTLPASYEAAKRALARCVEVDECVEWANKAAAVAVYARQAKDDTLVIMAQRIQARAIRRVGELIQDVPAGHWTRPGPNRTTIATAAGLSRTQRRQAAQIAHISAKQFERAVESEKPLRPYKLAELGIRHRGGRPKGGAIGSLRLALEKAQAVANERAAALEAALTNVREIRARLEMYLSRQVHTPATSTHATNKGSR